MREMHEKLSPDSLYLRFFSLNPRAAEREARRLCREPAPDHAALLALMDGELIGCGSYECDDSPSRSAEIALAVADYLHHRGVGTLLLEHLVSLARSRGLHAFTAETLSENALMLKVFADAGLQAHRALADGVYDLTFPLPNSEADMPWHYHAADVSGGPCAPSSIMAQDTITVVGAAGGPALSGGSSSTTRDRRLRPGARGQPGRGRTGRCSLRPVGGRFARGSRPSDHRHAGGSRDRYRRRMRAAGGQGPGGARGGTRRRGPRGAAGHLPPPRHANGRPGELRGGRHQRRP